MVINPRNSPVSAIMTNRWYHFCQPWHSDLNTHRHTGYTKTVNCFDADTHNLDYGSVSRRPFLSYNFFRNLQIVQKNGHHKLIGSSEVSATRQLTVYALERNIISVWWSVEYTKLTDKVEKSSSVKVWLCVGAHAVADLDLTLMTTSTHRFFRVVHVCPILKSLKFLSQSKTFSFPSRYFFSHPIGSDFWLRALEFNFQGGR